MLAQAKAMKLTWWTSCDGGAGRVRFQGSKKRPDEGKELNSVVANVVKTVLTTNKRKKSKASSDSGSEDKQEPINLKTLNIRGKCQIARTSRSNDTVVQKKGTEAEKLL